MLSKKDAHLKVKAEIREIFKGHKVKFEYYFHGVPFPYIKRLWRIDVAIPEQRIAIEIDGGLWLGKKGGHTTGRGSLNDRAKGNMLTATGWLLFRTDPSNMMKVFQHIKKWLDVEKDPSEGAKIFTRLRRPIIKSSNQ